MGVLEDKLQLVKPARTIHTFTFPAGYSEYKTIGLVELTSSEELLCTKRAQGDPVRLAFELVKQSVVEVDGKQVSTADGSADMVWDRLGPRARSLALSAYAKLHTADNDVAASFLETATARVD
jgi:hypothetical protein